MELVFLKGSPWSLKTSFVLTADGKADQLKYTEHVPMIGEPLLRWRLGKLFTEDKVTVPVLFKADGQGTVGSWDIVTSLCSDKMVPKDRLEEIKRMDDMMDEVCMFVRHEAPKHDNMALNLLPSPLYYVPLLSRGVASMSNRFFATKYVEDGEVTQEKVDSILGEWNRILERNEFVLGGSEPTYADINVAVALEMLCADCVSRNGGVTVSAAFPEFCRKVGGPMVEKYPALVEFNKKMFGKHFPKKVERRFNMTGASSRL